MKLLTTLTTLITVAAAAPSSKKAPTSNVDVKLEAIGNSEVKAIISNHGKQDIRVFKPGTILDTSAVQKVKVVADGTASLRTSYFAVYLANIHHTGRHVPFLGIRKRISSKTIQDASLEKIPAGKSTEVIFNVAQTYDLSSGGKFNVNSIGSLSYAIGNGDNKLVGTVPYHSNTVSLDVNGAKAAHDRASFHTTMKRAKVQSDCTGERLSVTERALSNCAQLASAAEQAASSGSAEKMEEYFKASDEQTRQTVAGVFSRVVQECSSTNSGVANYYCTDVGNYCSGNVLAYTVPSESYMVYCDLYFNDLPDLTTQCHAQDQATTNIHEDTHLTQIQGTDDLGYGYEAIQGLSADQELNNADTYALFSNAIYANC
ncbi:hypothetical protein QQS21_001439 [Conoideocrella luteorostrata]|uniref:Neutral protease 2 n=1 Tax=Conoideocrella luteorostrata TaxID=1105319 RepID=A0AAJ0CWX4_9HYPO|nr:hypothetical protein QQS21_001439 [Conoideocrella luteorostrata]